MKNVILIFLNVLISSIYGNDNISCSNEYTHFTICLKNREIIHVNQTETDDILDIIWYNVDSIAPNAFQDLSIRILALTLPQSKWEDTAVKLFEIQPKTFEGLRQVETLSIAYGFLQLEHNIFAALESLETLLIYRCRLIFAKNGSFTGLPRIKDIILSSSKSFEMFPGIFTGLDELKNLDLSSNKITTIRKNIFNHMKHLNSLNLSGNEITTIEAGSFDGMSIKMLHLKHNQLTVIPIGAFDGVSIDYLNLHYNQIVQIEPNAFGNSTVKELRYAGKYITIDKQLVGLGELTVLNGTFY